MNIWATITHLGDASFVGADRSDHERLTHVVCEAMRTEARERQIWMMHSLLRSPGTSTALWDEHYAHIRDAHESYLLLLTPGFADAVHGVSPSHACHVLQSISRSARAFNKRTVIVLPGIPPRCLPDVAAHIHATNDLLRAVASNDVHLCDLSSIAYEPWSAQGSRPADMQEAGRVVARVMMQNHCAADEWKKIHGISCET